MYRVLNVDYIYICTVYKTDSEEMLFMFLLDL